MTIIKKIKNLLKSPCLTEREKKDKLYEILMDNEAYDRYLDALNIDIEHLHTA